MMVNLFNSQSLNLYNDDAEVFSGLFTNPKKFLFAGETQKESGYQIVKSYHYSKFVKEMKRTIKNTENVSAFGTS
jgi:hypothetical protein